MIVLETASTVFPKQVLEWFVVNLYQATVNLCQAFVNLRQWSVNHEVPKDQ
jgi:hypothetical protein